MSGSIEQSDSSGVPAKADSPDPSKHRALRLVGEAIGSIRYGQVILTIHDGVVVQFDKLEKTRLR